MLRAEQRAAPVGTPTPPSLATVPGMAARDGGILKLKLADNRILKLTDCTEPDRRAMTTDSRLHRLAAWWPAIALRRVCRADTRRASAYLVSERDGRTLETRAAGAVAVRPRRRRPDVQPDVRASSSTDRPRPPIRRRAGQESEQCRPAPAPVRTPSCGPSRSGSTTHVRFEGVSPQPDDKPTPSSFCRIGRRQGAWEC